MRDRQDLERQYLGYIRACLEDKLMMDAPDHWPDERLEALEDTHINSVRNDAASFDAAMLDDEITMKRHAYVAVAILEQAIQREIANDLP